MLWNAGMQSRPVCQTSSDINYNPSTDDSEVKKDGRPTHGTSKPGAAEDNRKLEVIRFHISKGKLS